MPEQYFKDRAKLLEKDRITLRPSVLLDNEKVQYDPSLPAPDKALFIVQSAMKARFVAKSYREFKVGAAGWIDRGDNTAIAIKHGGNYKNRSGASEIDDHAEQVVLRNMQPGDHLSILAVIGLPQPDHASDKNPCTLHPCGKCRERLASSEYVSEKTLIITATPDAKSVQWGSLEAYANYHDESAEEGLYTAIFDATPAVFEPIVASGPIDAKTFPDVDTKEWNQKFTYPLLDWIHANNPVEY